MCSNFKLSFNLWLVICSVKRLLMLSGFKGLFTRREGYPSKRVNPSRRVKDRPALQAKFHR